jgi:PEGA domain
MRSSVRSRSLALAALVALALPVTAAAQRHAPRTPPQPSIGLPLPEIVPPLPPLGLPPAGTHPPSAARPPHVSQPIYRGGRRGPGHGSIQYPIGGLGYVVPAFGWGYPMAEPGAAQEPEPLYVQPQYVQSAPAYGTLRVEILAAASAQVYVDGYYTGTADQAAAGLDLEPGPHRVEVRAAGYEPLTFDVRITPNQLIAFRDALKRTGNAAAAPEPPPKAPAPSTFYVIQGCYIGNVPPDAAKLPEGCDAARVQTFKQ